MSRRLLRHVRIAHQSKPLELVSRQGACSVVVRTEAMREEVVSVVYGMFPLLHGKRSEEKIRRILSKFKRKN